MIKDTMNKTFTVRQGQFLAYIYKYTMVNGCAPSEADMQKYFQITPPSVHSMVLTLERRGLIRRVPGQARSISLIISPKLLPPLGTGSFSAISKIKNITRKSGTWRTVFQQLATWEKPELLTLVQILYDVSAENRDIIHTCSKNNEDGNIIFKIP